MEQQLCLQQMKHLYHYGHGLLLPVQQKKMIDAFEKANPDITIDYTNYNYNPEYLQALSAASASDNLADIVGLQPGSLTQTYSDYLIDLSDYAKAEWGDDWTSVYDNVHRASFSSEIKMVMMDIIFFLLKHRIFM